MCWRTDLCRLFRLSNPANSPACLVFGFIAAVRSNGATVMLVMDTSGSMRAKDLKPSRIEAAQQAAQQFIQDKPSRLRVGLVTVAGTAALAQAPTEERDALLKALEYLPLQYGSALGTGLLVSLEALLPGADIDAQKIINELHCLIFV